MVRAPKGKAANATSAKKTTKSARKASPKRRTPKVPDLPDVVLPSPPSAAASPPPAPSPVAPPAAASAPPPIAPAAAAGPWFTLGLGGAMLAQNAVLFWVLTAATYLAGLWLLGYLLSFLLLWILLGDFLRACSEASHDCTGTGPTCGPCVPCTVHPCRPCGPCNPCTGGCCGGSGGGCCGGSGGCCSGGSSSSSSSGGGCCGSGSSSSTAAPTVNRPAPGEGFAGVATGLGMAAALRRGVLRVDLAHHPDGPAYAQDVWTVRARRLCVGCFTVFPAFMVALAVVQLALPAGLGTPAAWMASGTGLAGLQAISSAGWARRRWAKVLVKASLGVGLAALVHGVLGSGWPHLTQGAVLTGVVALASLSALPRRRRMARDAMLASRA